ncbi:MAG TPA: GAF domain-containing protein, partial [Candidatus Binatia bacterium]|nr:GAF domain-containing protein [Candidatus Binatia bacterium]
MKTRLPEMRVYGVALLASGVVFALSLLLSPPVQANTFAELFLVAVAFSAWYGGLAAGLLATAACAGLSVLFWIPPFDSLLAGSPSAAAQVGLFLLAAIVISALRGTVRAARERARLSARAAERQRERIAFLADASKVLGGSLDYETTLAAVARLAVPFLADMCVVDLLDDGGTVRRLAIEHVDPAMQRFARELFARYPPHLAPNLPILRVLEQGQAELFADVSPELLARIAVDAEHLAGLRRIAARSGMSAPLVVRGRVIGALSFSTSVSGRRYEAADLVLAEDLASRCATAIDNARLYGAAQDEIAERKSAEERLRESEERLQLGFDAGHMGTWDWNLGSGDVRADWGGGDEPSAGNYEAFLHRIHPADRRSVSDALARAIETRGEFDVELRLVRPDGTARWLVATGKVVCNEGGRPVRVVAVPMDVTKRKRTEQRLAVQHETTRILAECATLEEATPRILRAVCECLDWAHGGLWSVDAGAGVLRCVETWTQPTVPLPEFQAVSRATAFQKGVGLPGRVWECGEPVWIADVVPATNFPRA